MIELLPLPKKALTTALTAPKNEENYISIFADDKYVLYISCQ